MSFVIRGLVSLCGVALLVCSVSIRAATPDDLLEEIHSQGARAVMKRMFDDQKFGDSVYTGVSSGSIEWVRVGAALLPDSDASVSLELESSLAVALTHAPENVLPLVNSSPVFAASEICLPFMSDEEPVEHHLKYLRELERSLERVSSPALQRAKAACTRELDSMRQLLRK